MNRHLVVLVALAFTATGCLVPDMDPFGDDFGEFDTFDDSVFDSPTPPERPREQPRRAPSRNDNPTLPDTPHDYSVELPAHYLVPPVDRGPASVAAVEHDTMPASNQVTNEGAALGRVLFYDTRLSANGTTSCASCHVQELGFGDSERLSIGFDGERTHRHSMSLTNARFYAGGKFFWDERADTLEEQVLMPFQDPIEMGLTLPELERLVSEQPYYDELFVAAFGDQTVTSDRIARALAQFVRSMVSVDSPYDRARANATSVLEDFPEFTDDQNLGKRLFFAPPGRFPCAGCHASDAFMGVAPGRNDTGATNNGINSGFFDDDLGLGGITGSPEDEGRFKVPSLRNVAVTAPYMHDGRFDTLGQVVRHYSDRIEFNPNLDPALQDDFGSPLRYDFSPREVAAMVAFLETLTDEQFLTDEKFSDPFQ
jgi:cytochrome c peroxidase